MTRFVTLGALLLSTACLEVKSDDTSVEPSAEPGSPSTEPGSPTSDPSTEPSVEPLSAWVVWDSDGALLNVENADDNSLFYFGIAQTQHGAYTSSAQAEAAQQWTAEDCTGQSGQGDFCHEVPSAVDGYASLELISSSYGSQTSEGDPQYTLLTEALEQDGFTYILDDSANEKCYVWGDTPAYYDDFYYSCEYMPEWD